MNWNRSLLSALAAALLMAAAGIKPAAAQVTNDQASPDSSLLGPVENAVFPEKANNPIENFEGWSRLYDGYKKTPILFDSVAADRNEDNTLYRSRKYPALAYDSNPRTKDDWQKANQQNSLRIFNLGVDDEVNKSALAVFTPISVMHQDAAWDATERERFLNLFKTYNGIAKLTLSYLDKTVAAGLEATNAAASDITRNQMLKQIQWTSSQLANPQRAMLYKDVDEKLEACLRFGPDTQNTLNATGRVQLNCAQQCLPAGLQPPTTLGQGLFNYCVCCAQSSPDLNSSTVVSVNDPDLGKPWASKSGPNAFRSLVDEIIFGNAKPTPDGVAGAVDKVKYLTKLRTEVRDMYGDVTLSRCGVFPLDDSQARMVGYTPKDSATCDANTLKQEYHLPRFSVPEKVRIFRDGTCEKDDQGNIVGCPITDTPIKEGICPSLLWILNNWPPDFTGGQIDQEMKKRWVQASFGQILTARDIDNMTDLAGKFYAYEQNVPVPNGPPGDTLRTALQFSPKFNRWVESWCDASAVAAFKRYHYRMMSLVEDHLRLSQFATEKQKTQMRELLDRVTLDLQLAEQDYGADHVARSQLAGLEIETSKNKQGRLTASVEALNANQENVSALMGGTSFTSGNVGSLPLLDELDPTRGDTGG